MADGGGDVAVRLFAGGREEPQLAVGGDEQQHQGSGEVRDCEEPSLSKKSRKEQKRKKLHTRKRLVDEKRKRLEDDSRPWEAVKTNKQDRAHAPHLGGCSPSATLPSLRIRSPMATVVRSPGVNLLMSTPGTLPRMAALKRGISPSAALPTSSQTKRMRSPSPATPCYTIHFPSPMRSPSSTRTSHGSRRKPRKLKSDVWKEAEPIYRDGKLAEGKCIHCHQTFPASRGSGTSQIGRHLKVCEMRTRMHDMVDKMHSSATSSEVVVLKDWKFDPEVSRRELVRMIVRHELPFSLVEYDGFRSFVASLNPIFKMISRTTAQADCITSYKEHRSGLRNLFKDCNSRVSLTADMWTSNQNLGYLCITCHFIDNEWNVQKRIIRFCPMETPHDALNMYNVILKSIQDWHIEDKIFSFTLDNASVNTAMINFLKENLLEKHLLNCQGKLFHIRCASHVLNIIVQDGLKEIGSMIDSIRNSVKYVKSSQSRKEKFEEIIAQVGVSEKHPSLDVATRWNSTFLMLKSALPFKAAFYALAQQDSNYKYTPTSLEWRWAEDVVNLLRVFYTATKVVLGSKYPTSNHYFHGVWLVKKSLENGTKSRNPIIVAMVKEMQEKFDKYWKESYLANCIPVILDPRYKYDYIEFRLKMAFGSHAEKHLDEVNEAMRILFDE